MAVGQTGKSPERGDPDVTTQELQALVRQLRVEVLRVTQKELGKLMGVTRQSVYWWERGRSRPTNKQIKKMLGLLGLTHDNSGR